MSSRQLTVALSAIFFLSGGASLLFETLWFRECGLVFGNGAWASAIVLGSFMAGLAIGNVLSTRFRGEPLRVYAALEITIGICGLLLVIILPLLSSALAPLFRHLLDSTLLNAARLICAFVLLLIPAIGMGATLPTLVSALSRHDANFGRVLGLLYGSNTIGAVAGALAGELLLI
ncbi:MAG TPA: spermidine synthase, partial [Thermoanaerobaculia bacterium]